MHEVGGKAEDHHGALLPKPVIQQRGEGVRTVVGFC